MNKLGKNQPIPVNKDLLIVQKDQTIEQLRKECQQYVKRIRDVEQEAEGYWRQLEQLQQAHNLLIKEIAPLEARVAEAEAIVKRVVPEFVAERPAVPAERMYFRNPFGNNQDEIAVEQIVDPNVLLDQPAREDEMVPNVPPPARNYLGQAGPGVLYHTEAEYNRLLREYRNMLMAGNQNLAVLDPFRFAEYVDAGVTQWKKHNKVFGNRGGVQGPMGELGGQDLREMYEGINAHNNQRRAQGWDGLRPVVVQGPPPVEPEPGDVNW